MGDSVSPSRRLAVTWLVYAFLAIQSPGPACGTLEVQTVYTVPSTLAVKGIGRPNGSSFAASDVALVNAKSIEVLHTGSMVWTKLAEIGDSGAAGGWTDGTASNTYFQYIRSASFSRCRETIYLAEQNSGIRLWVKTGGGNSYLASDTYTLFGAKGWGAQTTVIDGSATTATFPTPGLMVNGYCDQSEDFIYVSHHLSNGAYTIRKLHAQDDGSGIFKSLNTVTTVAGNPTINGYDDGAGTFAQFPDIQGLAYNDQSKMLYVAQAKVIRAVAVSGIPNEVTTLAGSSFSSTPRDGPMGTALFQNLAGLSYDASSGSLIAIDAGGVRSLNIGSQQATTVAGQVQMYGDIDGPLLQARFNSPDYPFADTANNRLYLYSLSSSPSTGYSIRSMSISGTTSPTASPAAASPTTTMSPTTVSPTTVSPTTSPVTASPTTNPATNSPTASPATVSPVTVSPATAHPLAVTASPATMSPSASPATASPATASPLTASPTTASPLTASPSPVVQETKVSISAPDVISCAQDTFLDAYVSTSNSSLPSLTAVSFMWQAWRHLGGSVWGRVYLTQSLANVSSLRIRPGELLPGATYRFVVAATHNSATSGNAPGPLGSATVYRNTSVSSLVASIIGGSLRTQRVDTALTLDASASYDPDQANSTQVSWAWVCDRGCGAGLLQPSAATVSGWPLSSAVTFPANTLSQGTKYRFNVTFSTLISTTGLVRTAKALVDIDATAAPVPTVLIGAIGGTRISAGQPIQIIAEALPAQGSSSTASGLAYAWTQVAGSPVPGPFGSQASLVVASAGLSGDYTFRVQVTDTVLAASALAALTVTVAAPPVTQTFGVIPLTGGAFKKEFVFSASATGDRPLHFRFSIRLSGASGAARDLSSFTSSPSLNTTLPPGTFLPILHVMDALGGVTESTATGTVTVSEPSPPLPPGGGSVPPDCETYNRAEASIRQIIDSSGASINATADIGVCVLVSSRLDSLAELGMGPTALRTVSYLTRPIDDIPRSEVEHSRCGGVQTGCEDGALGSLTLGKLARRLWALANEGARRVIEAPNAPERNLHQASQSLAELSRSPVANASASSIAQLAEEARLLVEAASTTEVASEIGNRTAAVVSNLVGLANTTLSSDAAETSGAVETDSASRQDLCASLDSSVRLLDRVLFRAAEGYAPGSPPARFNTERFTSSSRSVFADAWSDAVPTGGTRVALPPSKVALGESRPRAVLAVAEWEGGIDQCRRGLLSPEAAELEAPLASHIVSVTLSDVESNTTSTLLPRTYFVDGAAMTLDIPMSGSAASASCQYWDTGSKSWTASGCVLVRVVDGVARCKCTHLTEFAIVSSGDRESAPREDAQSVYSVFVAAFAVLAALALLQIVRLLVVRDRGYSMLAHGCLLAHSVTRVMSCVFFGQLDPRFSIARAPDGVMLAVAALPYTFALWTYSLLVFQWIALVHNQKLSRTPFRRVRGVYTALNVVAVALAWTLLASSATGGGSGRTSALLGSCVFAGIYGLTAAGNLLYGFRFADLMGASAIRKARADMFRRHAWLVACCFVAQSITWVVSYAVRNDGQQLLWATATFLLFDCIGIALTLLLYRGAISRRYKQARGLSKRGTARRRATDALSATTGNASSADSTSDLKSDEPVRLAILRSSQMVINSGKGSRQNEIAELQRCSASEPQIGVGDIEMTAACFHSDANSPERTPTPPPRAAQRTTRGTRLARIENFISSTGGPGPAYFERSSERGNSLSPESTDGPQPAPGDADAKYRNTRVRI